MQALNQWERIFQMKPTFRLVKRFMNSTIDLSLHVPQNANKRWDREKGEYRSAYDILIFFPSRKFFLISIQISMKFVLKVPVGHNSALK